MRVGLVESDSNIEFKVFIVQSSPILCPHSDHTLGYNLHLNHPLGEENYLPNTITKKSRSPVRYMLLIYTC